MSAEPQETADRDGLLQHHLPIEAVAGGVEVVSSALAAAAKGAPAVLAGLGGGAISLALAAWFRGNDRSALLVAPTPEQALQLADDLEAWLGRGPVVHLPQQEVLAFDRKSPDPALVGAFFAGLERVRSGEPCLAVTSLYAMRLRTLPPARLDASIITLEENQRIDPEDLCLRLAELGYRPAGMVARVGDYARRGGLLDIFAPGGDPLRVEFFDDEIVSLRSFSVESQRSGGLLARHRIFPVTPLILDDDSLLTGLAKLEAGLAEGLLEQDDFDDLEARFEERQQGEGLETWLPFFTTTALTRDYLPPGTAVFWLDPVRLGVQSELLDEELPRLRETRLSYDSLLPQPGELVASTEELAGSGTSDVLLAESWISGDESGWWLDRPAGEFACRTGRPRVKGGDVVKLREELLACESRGETVLMLCDNSGQAERLADLIEDCPGDAPATPPTVASLSSGFVWPELGLNCYTDHEFFERYRRPSRVRHKRAAVAGKRRDLQPGEYVVHLDYGVGIYRGLHRIAAAGGQHECLKIEYAEGGKVFVPVEKIDSVERFSSDSEATVRLARLGSASWLKVTKKARKAIRAMAAELIELYAARKALPGHAFIADTPMQKALADSFLFTETPDQQAAITAVKTDMEKARPMDRLVCGDVGYGKTEVAIRAAFKAVAGGRQVAVLCPTTLLATQHGETFTERFRDFPIRVGTLSRFRSPGEQRELLKRAKAGKLDILIGTHRLLSRDVGFENLGLIIIDEEQRFGVRHKERLKQLRRQVDVITLSATPIPRTLYLALMGARDMSLINTPPRDRLPIQTELCAFSERILTEAILREVHRDGQVFFVHNRVQTIEATADLIRKLLPNVKVGVAHGQMKEERLEGIMRSFLDHEFDVLVTTSIIESGLDMPRVNTIIIDRADRFGLAQLYQLRGRVGRSSHRAFAYLMTPPGQVLTPEARRRLAALEEFQALGSGYYIAMRDLEIRGSGNLLGEEQHGHMEAIGFDLYCRLLEETVRELRGGGGVPPLDVKVDLRLAAYLPDSWIGDAQQKMDLYRRLARLREPRHCFALREEMGDRFGSVPEPAANLVATHVLRLVAGRCGIVEIRVGRRWLDFFFAGDRTPSTAIIHRLMEAGPPGLQFKAVDQFIMRIPVTSEKVLPVASAVLDCVERCFEEAVSPAPPGREENL